MTPANEIFHFTETTSMEEAVEAARQGTATDFYVDASRLPHAQITEIAGQLHDAIASRFRLWEPVVVGPLPADEFDLRDKLALRQVRTTTHSYDDYAAQMQRHRKWADSLGPIADTPNRGRG